MLLIIQFNWFMVYRGMKKATLEIMFIRANFVKVHLLFIVHSKLISEGTIRKNLNWRDKPSNWRDSNWFFSHENKFILMMFFSNIPFSVIFTLLW